MINKFFLIAVVFLFVSNILSAGPFRDIVETYGISVNTDTDSKDFFPEDWLKAPENAKAQKISANEMKRFPKILEKALSKYPRSVISNNIKSINLAKSISFYGADYGATNANGIIYLTSSGEKDGFTDYEIEASFHHEFSHMLKRDYDFPSKDWNACNPKGFKYRGSGVDSIKSGTDSQKGSKKMFVKGFLTEYATSNQNEDVATFSEWIFTKPADFKQVMKEYPKIKEKFEIWLIFMKKVSKKFTEEDLFK